MSVEECNLPPWSLYFIACDSLPCQYLSIKEFMHSTSNRELVSIGCGNRIPREDTQTTANGTTGRNEQMVVSDIINSYSYTTSAGIMNTDIIYLRKRCECGSIDFSLSSRKAKSSCLHTCTWISTQHDQHKQYMCVYGSLTHRIKHFQWGKQDKGTWYQNTR